MATTTDPSDQPPTTGLPAAVEEAPTNPSAQINTYHCICNQLILATTYTLSTLPQRRAPSLDRALILPIPPPPRSTSPSTPSSSDNETSKPRRTKKPPQTPLHYTLLITTIQDRRPVIVRREDGFEKRWLYRCGRCKVVVAYALDEVHFLSSGAGEGEGRGRAKGKVRLVYVLPGGLRDTEDMLASKAVGEEEVDLRRVGDR